MKVNVKTWHNTYVEELSSALTPSLLAYEAEGSIEQTHALAQKTANAFGRLAATLVKKNILTLDEAANAAGISDELTPID